MEKIIENKNFIKIIVILGVIILPLLYSLIYLKGFWNPYGNLSEVKVAIVNEDKCEENCKSTELIDKLKKGDVFDYKVVSGKEAKEGLKDLEYYAAITIPSDFTSSFEDAASKDRHEATLIYTPNKKSNYLAAQIISNAVNKIQAELHSEVSKEVVNTLTGKLDEVPSQTKQIENGLNTIYEGSSKLNSGATELKNGTNTLNTNYQAFDGGISELTNGLNTLKTNYNTLNNGINEIYDSVHSELVPTVKNSVDKLQNGVNELKSGSNELTNTIQNTDYQNQMNTFMDRTNAVYSGLSQICNDSNYAPLINSNEQLKQTCQVAVGYTTVDPQTNQTPIKLLQNGTNQIIEGQNKLNNGINEFSNNLSQIGSLNNGLNKLDEGLLNLQNGSSKVKNGIDTLTNGADTLNTNSAKIKNGIGTLNSSMTTLKDGTNTLTNGVNTAKTEIGNKISETENQLKDLNGLGNYTADPVKVKEESYGTVNQYGLFFTPYFMSLSLWVGGILIMVGLYYDPDNRFKILGRDSKKKGLRLVLYNIIGIIQAIVLAVILKACTGFTITNFWLYYGSCILISLAFLSIIMFLFFNFKDVGKFISIVMLVLQLAASGGTFPIQTEPSFYQTIYNFMPMRYSVELLRESLININSEIIIKDMTVLGLIFIVFGALTLITGYIKTKKQNEKKNGVKKVA